MRISDWSSDVCSSDLVTHPALRAPGLLQGQRVPPRADPTNLRGTFLQYPFGAGIRLDPAGVGLGSTRRAVTADPLHHSHDDGRTEEQPDRSEEHTSELQSLMRISYAVFCLKKKTNATNNHTHTHKNKTKQDKLST